MSLTIKARRGENVELVASDPSKFFMPPYMAHHGYVGIHLDNGGVDWDEIREFILDVCLAAPKRLAALVE